MTKTLTTSNNNSNNIDNNLAPVKGRHCVPPLYNAHVLLSGGALIAYYEEKAFLLYEQADLSDWESEARLWYLQQSRQWAARLHTEERYI